MQPNQQRVADRNACAAAIRQGSKSFYTASKLLPDRVRQPAFALYAFCRLADDSVDSGPADARTVDRLMQRLDRIYAGNPTPSHVDRAFARVVEDFDMPRCLPEALIEGLLWDVEGRTYHSLDDLLAYAARVASTVGAMMTVLMGERRQPVLARACDLGLAMQLTNIARDIGEDARNGRIYLPREWLDEAGIVPERWLADPSFTADVGRVTGKLLATAEHFYRQAMPGIAYLPLDCRPAIAAAAMIYREIGRKLAASGYDSINQRTVVSARRKAVLLSQAALRIGSHFQRPLSRPIPATQFLVSWSPETEMTTQLDRGLKVIVQMQVRERASRAQRRGLVHG